MPGGIPVATVALDGGKNAGLLAARILGAQDEAIRQKMADYQESLRAAVQEKYERVERDGWRE
jgi:5-(carboxyamino)imidazole ribonucleotide mutase